MPAKKTGKKQEKDLVTQALLIGFGLMNVTKKKVKESVDEFKKQKNINDKDAQKAAREFISMVEKGRKDAERILREQVKKTLDDLGREVVKNSSSKKPNVKKVSKKTKSRNKKK